MGNLFTCSKVLFCKGYKTFMELKKIRSNASVIEATLEAEGIMPIDELQDLTNIDEKEVLVALDWLSEKKRVQLFPTGKVISVMLVF